MFRLTAARQVVRQTAADAHEVNILRLRDADGRSLVAVGADVIWFADQAAADLRPRVAASVKCSEDAVVLAASHTHGSPQPDARFAVGQADPEWEALLTAAIADVARQLSEVGEEAVALEIGQVPVTPQVMVNRRRKAWYFGGKLPSRRVQNMPNPGKPVDDRLTLIVARDRQGAARAAFVHFTCHPVALPRGIAGTDYPGALRRHIRNSLGQDLPVVFLQGHCGDIRPYLLHQPKGLKDRILDIVIGQRFRASKADDVDWMMRALGPAVQVAIGNVRPLASGAQLQVVRDRLAIDLASGVPSGRHLDVTVWRVGDLSLVFASGEMLSGLRSERQDVLSVGYSNGMVGYVAPSDEYAGGGYEIDGFAPKFGLPGRLANTTGDAFIRLREQLLARLA